MSDYSLWASALVGVLTLLAYRMGYRRGRRELESKTPDKPALTKAYAVSLHQGNVFTTSEGVRVGVDGPVEIDEGNPQLVLVPVVPMDTPGAQFKLKFELGQVLELEE